MTTKEEYQEIGTTKEGERIYRSTRDGCVCTEKDHSYLVHSTQREMEEVGIALIEESCSGMQVWIPTEEKSLAGEKVFRNTRDGCLAVRRGKNNMELVEEAMTK